MTFACTHHFLRHYDHILLSHIQNHWNLDHILQNHDRSLQGAEHIRHALVVEEVGEEEEELQEEGHQEEGTVLGQEGAH